MARESDKDFEFRYLERDDYDKGFMDTLSQLTVVGNVTKDDFQKRFDEIYPKRSDVYKIVVLIDRERNYIIGAGTIFFEKKFIRGLGLVNYLNLSYKIVWSH